MTGRIRILINSLIVMTLALVVSAIFATSADAFTAWSKNKKGQFVNDQGKVIAGATMKGIDVSKWNGNINWKKVAASDVDFAIIRCGYGDNLTSQDDAYWEKNVAGCIANNIPFGTYLYSYALNNTQAKSEADHVLRLLNGREVYFPIYYDMEDNTQEKLGKAKIGKIATKFMNTISGQGYKTGIYASLYWWDTYFPTSITGNLNVSKWIAQWASNNKYKGTYNMWQSTSKGKVNGISGNVDINFWFGEYNPDLYKKTPMVASQYNVVTRPGKTKIKSITAGRKKLKIKWKKVNGTVGYKVRYSLKKNMTKYKTKFVKGSSVLIKKLKPKKRYYVMVRTFKTKANGTRLYSLKWSNKKSKKTKR